MDERVLGVLEDGLVDFAKFKQVVIIMHVVFSVVGIRATKAAPADSYSTRAPEETMATSTANEKSNDTKNDAKHDETQHPAGQPAPHQVGATPSGVKGENPATAGPGKTGVQSNTSENATGHLNPSAPEDANVTPGSVGEK